MKLDIGQLVGLIGVGMRVAERFKGAKTGKEKESAVIESVQKEVPAIEALSGLDFVNDENLNALLKDYIAAKVALANGVAHAKGLDPHAASAE